MKRNGEALRIIERQRIGEEMICAGLDQTCGDVLWTEADSISLSERGKRLQRHALYQVVTELICNEQGIPENIQIDWLS